MGLSLPFFIPFYPPQMAILQHTDYQQREQRYLQG